MSSFSHSGVACGVVSTTRLLDPPFVTTHLRTCSDERRVEHLFKEPGQLERRAVGGLART